MIKKTFARALLAIAVAVVCPAIWAQVPGMDETPISFATDPGGYAIYRLDGAGGTSGAGGTAYIGVCNTRGNELAIRLYDTVTKRELLVLQTFYTSGTGDWLALAPGMITPVKGSFETPLEGKFLSRVNDALSSWIASRDSFADKPCYTWEKGGPMEFEYWVPVMQLRSAPGLTLVTAGYLSSADDPAFFRFIEEPKSASPLGAAIVPGKPVVASIGGVSVGLDSNWVAGEDGLYRFPDATARDACCYVETISTAELNGMDIFDLIRCYLLYSGGVLIARDVRLFAVGEDPCAFYRVWDPLTGRQSAQYRLFLPHDAKAVSVLCIAAFSESYDGNEEYFNSILLRTEP